MARESADREDLMREATALVARVELASAKLPNHFVAGFRRDGCLSLFFGPDPVYQFNTAKALRRAFFDDCLYKAEHGRLVRLTRQAEADVVQLLRHELTDTQQQAFLSRLENDLATLGDVLDHGQFEILQQAPPDEAIIETLRAAVSEHRKATIAQSPHAR